MTTRWWRAGLLAVALIYLHNAMPYLTMMPRVNVDEPWLMERGYEVMRTGIPSQPMLRLDHAYLLQVGYGYLLAAWMWLFGVGLLQVRLLAALLGLGIVVMVAVIGRRTIDPLTGVAAALFLALDRTFWAARGAAARTFRRFSSSSQRWPPMFAADGGQRCDGLPAPGPVLAWRCCVTATHSGPA